MAMLLFLIGLLLVVGVGMVVVAMRRAAAPGARIDLDLSDDGPDRPSRDQG